MSLPSRSIIFLNSLFFLHIIPFIDFECQFMCNPRGVFIGDPFILKRVCFSTTSMNKYFHTSHFASGFVSEKLYSIAVVQHRRGSGGR